MGYVIVVGSGYDDSPEKVVGPFRSLELAHKAWEIMERKGAHPDAKLGIVPLMDLDMALMDIEPEPASVR